MKTTLLIMAAGIGSRFGGGIKQLEPVDNNNHIIMDYSIHDAIEAGFNHVVFIIRRDIEEEFKEVIGERISGICEKHGVTVDYAFQDINDIPGSLPEGRTKPLNVHMNDAITQLKNHMEYINRNYSSFRTQIHEDKDKAINEEYSGNYLVGPRKNLLVDPQKDIDVKYIAIGGVEREDKSIEESHEIVKCKPADNLEIASWNSFVRKLDEYHGHHPVQ